MGSNVGFLISVFQWSNEDAMDRVDNKIQRSLISHWDTLKLCITRLNTASSVHPQDGYTVVKHLDSSNGAATFEIEPILVNLPERANDSSLNLFVVVRGRLAIDRSHFENSGALRTSQFATEAGYFRLKTNELQHVYGAHYDFAEDEVGHPVFHAQMKSFADFAEIIKAYYSAQDLLLEDGMKAILKTVRLPSAQMDVFSFMLQLVADHLLSRDSSDDDKSFFYELVQDSKRMQGAAFSIERLQVPPANLCYRSAHWYPPH
jgi:hypothetical protein